ncbi:DUF6152 family protein [Sphingobium nicotianae]|uniref:Uncharacterized protein n=1 Tax=Sphingobium nicotianae TaxID=2782607 RepID=A0A9X1DE13_9SPHN|nr:DUF6152 family protein [Sphingobium nicotianae]MBT2188195.1 hypothetical protein [Sphingobium nicotianae]
MAQTTKSALRLGLAVLMSSGLALTAIPSPAHHSTAMFNWGKEIPMTGATVERWDWTNPHTFLYVTINGKAGPEHWAFEGMSPNHLGRIGWTKHTLKPGDKIDLTYYALKDGRKGGFNVTIKLPNGQVKKQLESPGTRPDQPGS